MKNINAFVYGVDDILREISKKGTESDIRFYNRKDQEGIAVFIEPFRYPDKLSSLTDSIFPTDIFIINGNTIDRNFGEVVLALDIFGKREGIIVAGEEKRKTIDRIMKDTSIKYTYFDGNPNTITEMINNFEIKRPDGNLLIVIDHFFKVKSVGTVVLGFVLSGTVKKHDDLFVSELNRKVQVRSIQIHDVDYDEAGPGVRVGLSLKGIETEELSRGMFLSNSEFRCTNEIKGDINIHPLIRNADTGGELFVSDMMMYERGTYEDGVLQVRHKLPVIKKNIVLSSPNSFPRVIGTIKTDQD